MVSHDSMTATTPGAIEAGRSHVIAEMKDAGGGQELGIKQENKRIAEMKDAGARRLQELGIKQENKRHFSSLATFGLSSCMCSVIVGIIPLYGQSIRAGGPGVMIWDFVIIGFFALTHAFCLAEMASAYPTAGTLQYWSFQVGGPVWGPFLSWMTGWLNMLGQVASIGATTYASSLELVALATILGPANVSSNQAVIFGVFTALLLLSGFSNIFTERILAHVSVLGIITHLLGCIFIVILVLAFAPHLQSASFVFTHFENKTGIDTPFSVYLIGSLSAATTYTGYDSGASVAEETVNSLVNSPRSMIWAVTTTILLGSMLIVSLNFSIQDVSEIVNTDDGDNVFSLLVMKTVGSAGTVAFHCVLLVVMQCTGCANVTSVSRLIYSFSREGALPFSDFWRTMNVDYNSPVRAIFLGVALAWLLGFLGWQGDMFLVFFSLSTVAYYSSYLIPVLARVTVGRHKNYERSPWSLGCLSLPMCAVSACFCCFITIVLCLPLSSKSFNYAGPDLLAALVCALASWVYARHWYKKNTKLGLPVSVNSVETFTSTETDLSTFDRWHYANAPASLVEVQDSLDAAVSVKEAPHSLKELQDNA